MDANLPPQRGPVASRAVTGFRLYLAIGLASLPAACAWGQVVSSADAATQELLREQERTRVLRQQQERSPDVSLQTTKDADSVRLRFDESPCFAIERIILEGDAARQFQWALAAADKAGNAIDSATGACLGTAGVTVVLHRVQNTIVDRGFVTTRVVVEPQNLSTGTLKLTLIPGRIRQIRLLPGSDPRATMFNAVPAAPGDLLNLRDIEQGLENFKRPPTVQADIQILPASTSDSRAGESDLGINWKQDFPVRLSVSADDSGSRATGKHQGSVTLAYDHWWTLNDLFYISFSHDLDRDSGLHGTRGRTAHYSIPFGYWLLAVTASSSPYYQSVSGVNQTYVYRGDSENANVTLSWLVYRDATRKTTLSLGEWGRTSRNFIDDTEVQVQRRRMGGWEFGLAHREMVGAAALDLRVNYRHGTGALNALRAPEEAFGEGTSRFALVTADGNLGMPFVLFGQSLRYSGAWRIQSNRTPLIAQDRFSIGGRYTVRGFDGASSLLAERGWLLRNEVGAVLGASGQELYFGIDHGEVGGPSSHLLVGRRLSGAVVGLRGQIMKLQYDVFAGAPVRKPELFRTAASTAGFSATVNF